MVPQMLTFCLWQTGEVGGYHVVRANIRDAEGKRYAFILLKEESWKVALGLQSLKRGTQTRSMQTEGISIENTKGILRSTGYL